MACIIFLSCLDFSFSKHHNVYGTLNPVAIVSDSDQEIDCVDRKHITSVALLFTQYQWNVVDMVSGFLQLLVPCQEQRNLGIWACELSSPSKCNLPGGFMASPSRTFICPSTLLLAPFCVHIFMCVTLLVWIVLGTNLVAHAWQVHYSNNSNEAQLCRITTLKSQIHLLWPVPGMVAKMHRNASSVFGLYCIWGHFSSSIFHSVWSLFVLNGNLSSLEVWL